MRNESEEGEARNALIVASSQNTSFNLQIFGCCNVSKIVISLKKSFPPSLALSSAPSALRGTCDLFFIRLVWIILTAYHCPSARLIARTTVAKVPLPSSVAMS
jgi:hypothetical protein